MREYNPLKVVGSWATPLGVYNVLQAVIPAEFLSTSRDNKYFARENDLFGNSTRVVQPNTGGQITVRISRSDPINDDLTKAHLADRLTSSVVGLLSLKDLNGTTKVKSADAFIEDVPDPSFSNARGQWDWVFQVGKMLPYIGSHAKIGG